MLPGECLQESKTCWRGLSECGVAGAQWGETFNDGGERRATAGGEHPDWVRRGGAGGRTGDETTGPTGWPQVHPGAQWLQELHGQAREVSHHVEGTDCSYWPHRGFSSSRGYLQLHRKSRWQIEIDLERWILHVWRLQKHDILWNEDREWRKFFCFWLDKIWVNNVFSIILFSNFVVMFCEMRLHLGPWDRQTKWTPSPINHKPFSIL